MSEKNTNRNHRFVTAEAVRAGHPDKFCDQLADRLLDECLRADPNTRAAIEVMAADGKVLVAGEITTEASVDVERTLKQLCAEVGYTMDELSTDGSLSLEGRLNQQSPDIAQAVGEGDKLGAGDQGIMVGYATDETPERMTLPVLLAQKLCRRLDESRIPWLKPDGKAQVTVLYQDDTPVAVTAIVVSVQHEKSVGIETIRREIKEIIRKVIPEQYLRPGTRLLINPSGRFVLGGPAADTGLTGRKLAVDAYGPVAHIGGGSSSGKDATKVDRTGAYAARWVAKSLVDAGLAKRCEVQIAYAIGRELPVSVDVETFGTGLVPDDVLCRAVRRTFDLRPEALIRELKLRCPVYASLAVYGHFGRTDINPPWEETELNETALLLAALMCAKECEG
jgi:S-adenosylmethionine synthetase